MKENKHWAVFLSNNADKNFFIKQLFERKAMGKLSSFNNMKGMLFSDLMVNEIIEEESIRDGFIITKELNRNFNTLSGGERKKALLKFCLDKHPGYIIFDDPFDHLDIASQKEFQNILQELSSHIIIIQLISRRSDVLPFIDNGIHITDDNSIIYFDSVQEYLNLKNKQEIIFTNELPFATNTYSFNNKALVVFNNVSVSYNGRSIVKNINWEIKSNEFWQLIGPNGSGKTTLLSMIIGDNTKGYGQDFWLFGKRKGSGESVWEIKEKVGYFTSSMIELFSRNNTLEQMIISGFFDSIGLYIKPTELQMQIAKEWLSVINMLHLHNKIFTKLTTGQQRIALIARAMVKAPPLLILDEPTAGLDDDNVQLVNELINKIAAEKMTSILYVSHRTEEGLTPTKIFELIPTDQGSIGKIMKQM